MPTKLTDREKQLRKERDLWSRLAKNLLVQVRKRELNIVKLWRINEKLKK